MADDDGLEVLDLGSLHDPGPEADRGPRRPSRRAVLALGGLAAAGAGLTALGRRGSPQPPGPRPAPVPDAQVVVTDLRRPLLAGAAFDVFAFNQQELVRVELATGRVTRTGLGGLEHAPLDVVPVRGGALVHRSDDGPGWFVPDGRPPTGMARRLEGRGPMLPGPDLDHVWVMGGPTPNAPVRLVGLDGRPTSTGVGVAAQLSSYPVPDGGGYPLFFGVTGTYWGAPGGLRRITSGAVLAGGETGWLVLECDDPAPCGAALVGRAGGRTAVQLTTAGDSPELGAVLGGALAPDGRRAALYVGDPARSLRLDLVDLVTGARVTSRVKLTPGAVLRTPRWSPDGRLVVTVDRTGRILAVDAAGRTGPLVPDGVLPAVEDVAIRA